MLVTFIRTIILYIVICFSLRIMGKRQIGELQPTELVVTILISNIATLPIEDTNIPLFGGLVPIFVLVCLEVFSSILGIKSRAARKLICGNPAFIIKDGEIDQKMLKTLRFSIDDLFEGLREQEIFSLSEVKYAIVETTGKISVLKNNNAKGNIASPPVIIVSDGKIVPEGIDFCNVTREWVEKKISQKNHLIQDIFIMTCNREKQYNIIKRMI